MWETAPEPDSHVATSTPSAPSPPVMATLERPRAEWGGCGALSGLTWVTTCTAGTHASREVKSGLTDNLRPT